MTRPTGALSFIAGGEFSRSAPTANSAAGPVRAMSENGEYVFFDTTEKLVAAASNQDGGTPRSTRTSGTTARSR